MLNFIFHVNLIFFVRTAHAYHLNTLLVQLLKDAGLSLDWKDTILPLVKRVSEQVLYKCIDALYLLCS